NETGAYEEHYARMLQMYAAGYLHASDASDVAEIIHHAIHTDEPKLRYPVSWGGVGITSGRAAMTDEEWVAMGAIESRDDYIAEFRRRFGIDIST
ncbi:MAG: hypothetical protein KDB37_08180, partial [Ilumatobacter sp.]|nr:hypothetical protein [Ilumatobacter sp.]